MKGNRIDINNISIIEYIIKLCEKTRINKKVLEKNNIYLIKYEPVLPKGKCKGKTMMFFDETIKGKIIEQQTLMLYLGDLKFALICNEYDTTSYKKKVKTFKKYEDFEILSIIKKDASYKMKILRNQGYGFFNKYYYLEENQQQGGELVGGAGNTIYKEFKEGRDEALKDIYDTGKNTFNAVGNIPRATLNVGKKLGIGMKDGVKATGRSAYRLGELVPYGIGQGYSKGKDFILKEKEELERIKNDYNIIGDVIIIKFTYNVDEKKEYEYYGTIFKKLNTLEENKKKYEILFRSESIISDENIFEFGITYQGKYGDDYLYTIEICIEKDSQYYESEYNNNIEINDCKKKEKLVKINIQKIFSFYNYYRDIEKTGQTLIFKKIVSINKENNEKNKKESDYIPFVDINKNRILIDKLGIVYDTVFFNRELKPEKGFNSLKINFASKGNKCSGFNKRISCLFLFLDVNEKEVYLKGEHYAVLNKEEEEKEIKTEPEKRIKEEERIKILKEHSKSEEEAEEFERKKKLEEQTRIEDVRDQLEIEKKIKEKDIEKAEKEAKEEEERIQKEQEYKKRSENEEYLQSINAAPISKNDKIKIENDRRKIENDRRKNFIEEGIKKNMKKAEDGQNFLNRLKENKSNGGKKTKKQKKSNKKKTKKHLYIL